MKETVGISRCWMADLSNEEITTLAALIITLWVWGRNKESCYTTICEIMTPVNVNKNTQQLSPCSKHSLGLLDQTHHRLVFTGYQTARVRSESDENVTSLKSKRHNERHKVMVCLFPWQLIAHCNHNYDCDHSKTCYKKLVTHAELHANTVSLLESRE